MSNKHILEIVNVDYYVHKTRYVIIIQDLRYGGYMVWDYSGKEQHRILIASSHFYSGDKITFNNELPISEDPGLLWVNCKVSEVDFCNLVGTDFKSITESYDKYINNWNDVINRFIVKSIDEG